MADEREHFDSLGSIVDFVHQAMLFCNSARPISIERSF